MRARSLLVRTLDANSRRDLTSARWSASGDRSHERRDDEDTEGILLHISPRGPITRHGIYRTCEDAPAALDARGPGFAAIMSLPGTRAGTPRAPSASGLTAAGARRARWPLRRSASAVPPRA